MAVAGHKRCVKDQIESIGWLKRQCFTRVVIGLGHIAFRVPVHRQVAVRQCYGIGLD